MLSASTFTGYMAFSICAETTPQPSDDQGSCGRLLSGLTSLTEFKATICEDTIDCVMYGAATVTAPDCHMPVGQARDILTAGQATTSQDLPRHVLSPDTRGHCPPWGCLKWRGAPGCPAPACWGLHALVRQAGMGLCSPCMCAEPFSLGCTSIRESCSQKIPPDGSGPQGDNKQGPIRAAIAKQAAVGLPKRKTFRRQDWIQRWRLKEQGGGQGLACREAQPGSVGLELHIEISVLRVGDLQRGGVRSVIEQVLGNVAAVQR